MCSGLQFHRVGESQVTENPRWASGDGNGVSYGILQWTRKSGSLGRLLREMAAAEASN